MSAPKKTRYNAGDTVVMHTVAEAFGPHKGQIFVCKTDSYFDKSGDEVTTLKGFNGRFMCKYLAHVKLPEQ